MSEHVTAPRRASELRAWADAVTSRVNAIGVVGCRGMLVRDGESGFGFEPTPENKRARNAASGISPWAVRYVVADQNAGIPYTGLEIFTPDGCAVVLHTLARLNPSASRTADGSATALSGWSRIPMSSQPSAGDVYVVRVFFKPCAGIAGVDAFTSLPHGYYWAEAVKTGDVASAGARAGSALTVDVGQVSFSSDGNGGLVASYRHDVKQAVVAVYNRNIEFELWWTFTQPTSTPSAEPTLEIAAVYLRNVTFVAAGVTFYGDSLTQLTVGSGDTYVYLILDCTTSPPTSSVACYTSTAQAAAAKTATNIMVMLYRMTDGVVVADNRKSAMNLQVYQ